VPLLRGANLVRGSSTERRIEPYHDRVRETAIAAMAADARRMAHSRLALALEHAGHAEPDVLGLHWREAGQPARAADWFTRAGDRAHGALAFDQAAHLYQMALDCTADPPLALRKKLALALANTGQGLRAAELYLDCAGRTTADESFELRRRAMDQLIRCGHIDQGLALVGDLLRPLGISFPASPRAALTSVLLQRTRLALRGLRYQLRREADVPASALRRIDLLWDIGYGLSMVHTLLGADFCTRALLAALDAGEPSRLARSLALESVLVASRHIKYRRQGDQILQRAGQAAIESGDPLARGWARGVVGTTHFLMGRYPECLASLHEARALFASCPDTAWEQNVVDLYLLWTHYMLGRVRDIDQEFRDLRTRAQSRGDLMLLACLITSPASGIAVHLLMDRPQEARDDLESAMRQWSQTGFHQQHLYAVFAEADILLYEGKGQAAWDLLARREADLKRSLLSNIHLVRGTILFLRGRLALLLARGAASPARRHHLHHAETAATRLERERNGWTSVFAALLRGGIAHLHGRAEDAAGRFEHAATLAETAGMGLHGAAARFALGHCLGGTTGSTRQADALHWLRERTVAAPERFVASLVPTCR
jgi:tetratricopeptide (TPR) repeat protein